MSESSQPPQPQSPLSSISSRETARAVAAATATLMEVLVTPGANQVLLVGYGVITFADELDALADVLNGANDTALPGHSDNVWADVLRTKAQQIRQVTGGDSGGGETKEVTNV